MSEGWWNDKKKNSWGWFIADCIFVFVASSEHQEVLLVMIEKISSNNVDLRSQEFTSLGLLYNLLSGSSILSQIIWAYNHLNCKSERLRGLKKLQVIFPLACSYEGPAKITGWVAFSVRLVPSLYLCLALQSALSLQACGLVLSLLPRRFKVLRSGRGRRRNKWPDLQAMPVIVGHFVFELPTVRQRKCCNKE